MNEWLNELLNGIDWQSLIYAALLLLLGVALLIIEFFIVSFGLISLAAVASMVAAVYFAFKLGALTGWIFIGVAGLLALITIRWGINRIRSSRLVPRDEVTGTAGYRHVAERLGIATGSTGVMVTAARPTGRARFAGGECDVQTRGRPLEKDTPVIVKQIDGPMIFVARSDNDPAT
jgi:membrane-bound serine protease (ClpP class)